MGGHIVTGHVDAFGSVAEVRPLGESREVAFAFAPELARFIAEKGSITVSGVRKPSPSAGVEPSRFWVALYPPPRSR